MIIGTLAAKIARRSHTLLIFPDADMPGMIGFESRAGLAAIRAAAAIIVELGSQTKAMEPAPRREDGRGVASELPGCN